MTPDASESDPPMTDADRSVSSDEPQIPTAPPAPKVEAVRWLGEPAAISTRPGMYRRSFIGPDDGVRELFLEELTFHQGAAIPLHLHPVVEVFVVLAGALTFRLGDETIVVGPEHTVTIPPNTPHAVVNVEGQVARAFSAAPWDHDTFFREVTTYLEGTPRD